MVGDVVEASKQPRDLRPLRLPAMVEPSAQREHLRLRVRWQRVLCRVEPFTLRVGVARRIGRVCKGAQRALGTSFQQRFE